MSISRRIKEQQEEFPQKEWVSIKDQQNLEHFKTMDRVMKDHNPYHPANIHRTMTKKVMAALIDYEESKKIIEQEENQPPYVSISNINEEILEELREDIKYIKKRLDTYINFEAMNRDPTLRKIMKDILPKDLIFLGEVNDKRQAIQLSPKEQKN